MILPPCGRGGLKFPSRAGAAPARRFDFNHVRGCRDITHLVSVGSDVGTGRG